MKKLLFFVITFIICQYSQAQCQRWFGEPYDSVASIVNMIEDYSGIGLKPDAPYDKNSKRLYFIDSISNRDSLKLKVQIEFSFIKINMGNYFVDSARGLQYIRITGIPTAIKKIADGLRLLLKDCIILDNDFGILYGGEKERIPGNLPHRILIGDVGIDILRS